jgi:glucose-6-phosphate isomerase, archaeal
LPDSLPEPFIKLVDFQSGAMESHTTHIKRRASDLTAAFRDKVAISSFVEDGDPLIYEVFQYDVPKEVGQLIACTTVLQPGTVGDEYYMTKGHFHAVRGAAEVYLGLSGEGYLLLINENGETEAMPMGPGTLAYVPPRWAHRSVNTGDHPYVTLAVYPAQAGHDYLAVEEGGFGLRVVRGPNGPLVQ